MVYGCGNNIVKFLVFTTNLLLFVFGGLIGGFSLWANLDQDFARHLNEFAKQAHIDEHFVQELGRYQASLWIFVAVGSLLFVVGFLGCCGAACESIVLLTMHFLIMLILSGIEIFALVYMLINRSELLSNLKKFMDESATTADGRRNLLPIEKIVKCCGATVETAKTYIAEGLCEDGLKDMPDCYTVLQEKLEAFGQVVIIIGIIILIIQLFSMIFSCVLCRAFRERNPAYYA
uniref:Tetraspanin n=1 Tax=Acrobeloides nanus TaxID=290746 RepID=A0A914BZ70_9BILA